MVKTQKIISNYSIDIATIQKQLKIRLVLITKSHWRESRCEGKLSRTVLKPIQNGDVSGLGQPTQEQEAYLALAFGNCRWLYNFMLNHRTET
ncbi:helix-turn-helix domain-containing protein [Microseira sp. BLCC-F43]|uniref:helix-turn-helix domain-containing protein n=1 Tax=Microseira sp. BLCC-F43 TaxID=3153602 RepID=UPI0035B8DF7B